MTQKEKELRDLLKDKDVAYNKLKENFDRQNL